MAAINEGKVETGIRIIPAVTRNRLERVANHEFMTARKQLIYIFFCRTYIRVRPDVE